MDLTHCISSILLQQVLYLALIANVVDCIEQNNNNNTQDEDHSPPAPAADVGTALRSPSRLPHVTSNTNFAHRLQSENPTQHNEDSLILGNECLNGGKWIAAIGICECPITYGGRLCETHLCLNGGLLADDGRSCHCGKFEGKHCEQPACVGGMLNANGKCDCIGNYFGRFCELFCVHGRLVNGHCVCYDGFEGITCTRCNVTYAGAASGECGEVSRRRRPVMHSRFALSGLSLCLITIILLWISVVTRRRRTMLAATHFERMANERLLREQQRHLCERRTVVDTQAPRSSRGRAVCEFRQLIQAARNADVRLLAGACSSRPPYFLPTTTANAVVVSSRADTPPPEYCAAPQEAPPSYEEATRAVAEQTDALK